MNTAIHITGVSKIRKTHESLLRVLIYGIKVVLLKFGISLGATFIDVESLVFFKAFLVAIFHILAFTNCSHDVLLIAVLAGTNYLLLTLFIFETKRVLIRFSEFNNDVLVITCVELIHSE